MSLNKPVIVNLGETEDTALDNFVYDNLISLRDTYKPIHDDKLSKWRRLTKGLPKEKTREFPWPNASNVVVQVIGENVDTIKAIQLGSIYEILPLWPTSLLGDWDTSEEGEEQRSITERFMDEMGLSRSELDLYRTESKAAHDIASLGSVVVKMPYVVEKQVIVIGDGDRSEVSDTTNGAHIRQALTQEEKVVYEGPRPEKLAFEEWAATPTAQTWEKAHFKYHFYTLKKFECEKKVFEGTFDKKAWEKISLSPDREGMSAEKIQLLQDQGLGGPSAGKNLAEWDFYECWFLYWYDNKCYSICYTMHLKTKTRMIAFFNFYADNEEPFEFGRLGYSEDGLLGYGFAEMGEMYQEEASTMHNQRTDNRTLLNTSVILGGRNARMDAGITLFPMAVLPFSPDEIAIETLGAKADSSVPEEGLTLSLAKARFGTDMPGAEGMGSGTVDRKGNYSSMGTFSIMQQGNRRININVTDFRYLHLNIGRKSLKQYATFGVPQDKIRKFGDVGAKNLQKALDNLRRGRLELPIKAATASINKEIEKQTGMLFTQVMQRHYGAIAQILQGITNPTIPPEIKEFLTGSIGGMSYVMEKLVRAFGYDDIYRMQPEKALLNKMNKGAGNGNNEGAVSPNAGATPQGNGGQSIQQNAGQPNDNRGVSQPAPGQSTGGVLLR